MRFAALITITLALTAGAGPTPQPAAHYQLQLIWGTNRDKPEGVHFHPVESVLESELSRVFQWQHYWEVSRDKAIVSQGKPAAVRLSQDCEVQIEFVSSTERETRIYGKGVLVTKSRRKLTCKQWAIHGGSIETGGSWFVVVRGDEPVESK